MSEYYWHPEKGRTYLCDYPPNQRLLPTNADGVMWEEWIGFVDTTGHVCLRSGPWPGWTLVTQLGGPPETWFDAAKLILLSLKQTGSEEQS